MAAKRYDEAPRAKSGAESNLCAPDRTDPKVDALVTDLIGAVADKWTMLVPEALEEHGELRFTQLVRHVPGISQKMLTQTVRRMERSGFISRKVHAVVPPRVDYELTELGVGLTGAFCGVWLWAEDNLRRVEDARRAFDGGKAEAPPRAA